TQPVFAWSISSGPGSASGGALGGVFNSAGNAGSAVVAAAASGISGSATIAVSNAAPTVAIPATSPAANVTGSATTLSVLGADDRGESELTYSWTTSVSPPGTAPTFLINGSNAAKNVGVTFDRAGSYTF